MAQRVSYSPKVVEACRTIAEHVVTDIGPHGRGSPPLYPFSIIEVNWYLSRFLPREILSITRRLGRKVDRNQLAELFWGPSGIIHLLYCADFQLGGLAGDESAACIETIADLVALNRRGDIYCRDGRNTIWEEERVAKELTDLVFLDARGKEAEGLPRLLAAINVALWEYCILIQIGHRAYSHEFHGPYPVDDEYVLVREFHGLKPTEVWEFCSALPFQKLTTIEVYRDVEIRIDAFNHLDVVGASLPSKLQRFAVIVDDGPPLENRAQLDDLRGSCLDVLQRGIRTVRHFSKSDWVRKLLEMRCLWLKPHRDILGEDWEPSAEVLGLLDRIAEAENATGEYMRGMLGRVVGKPPEVAVEQVTEMFLTNVYQEGSSS